MGKSNEGRTGGHGPRLRGGLGGSSTALYEETARPSRIVPERFDRFDAAGEDSGEAEISVDNPPAIEVVTVREQVTPPAPPAESAPVPPTSTGFLLNARNAVVERRLAILSWLAVFAAPVGLVAAWAAGYLHSAVFYGTLAVFGFTIVPLHAALHASLGLAVRLKLWAVAGLTAGVLLAMVVLSGVMLFSASTEAAISAIVSLVLLLCGSVAYLLLKMLTFDVDRALAEASPVEVLEVCDTAEA